MDIARDVVWELDRRMCIINMELPVKNMRFCARIVMPNTTETPISRRIEEDHLGVNFAAI